MVRGVARTLRAFSGSQRRGYVLIVSLGMLMLLSVLGITFVTVSRQERSASGYYVDQVRARMLAEAGIERAVGELSGIDMNQPWSGQFKQGGPGGTLDPFGERDDDLPCIKREGNQTVRDPAGTLDGGKDRWFYGEMFNPARQAGSTLPGLEMPLPGGANTTAQWVSFPIAAGNLPATKRTLVAGAPVTWGYSGSLGSTYNSDPNSPGDVYSLKVLDCASMIYVNDDLTVKPSDNPLPVLSAAARVARVRSILDNLGQITGVGNLGNKVYSNRPAGGYQNKKQLAQLAFGSETAPDWLKVRDFLTVYAWSDPTTVRFNSTAGTMAGRGSVSSEPRAPINMNTASREVLMSVIAGISASYPHREAESAPADSSSSSESASNGFKWDSFAMPGPASAVVGQVADWIIARRAFEAYDPTIQRVYPHGDWMHVNDDTFNSLNGQFGAPNLPQGQRDMLKANFNPNSDIKKFNPDLIFVDPNVTGRTDFTEIDKSDLTNITTDLCFGSMGFYEIECVGRVTAPETGNPGIERIVAECKVSVAVKTYDVFRCTSQSDFEKNRLFTWAGSQEVTPGPRGGFLRSIVSLPEYPHARGPVAVGAAPPAWAAAYDGQLVLNGWVNHRGTASSYLAGYSDGTLAAFQGAQVQPGGTTRTAANLLGSEFFDGTDLYPFGVQIDSQRRKSGSLGRYLDLGASNFPSGTGTIEFWIKPEVDLIGSLSSPPSTWFRARTHVMSAASDRESDAFRIFFQDGGIHVFFFFSDGNNVGGQALFLNGALPTSWLPHTWHHVEVAFSGGGAAPPPGGGAPPPGGGPAPPPGGGGAGGGGAGGGAGAGHAWLFVDGNRLDDLALPRGLTSVPNLYLGAYTKAEHDSFFTPSKNTVATFDNICLHPKVLHENSFTPRSRYHDLSFQGYTYNPIPGRPGDTDVNGKHGQYRRQLKEIMDAIPGGGNVTIGTLSCTHWHPPHLHSRGNHQTGIPNNGLGHVTVTLMKTPSPNPQMLLPYDNCAGVRAVDLITGERMQLRTGDTLDYIIKMELAENGSLPHNMSPIVDDFTITFFTQPRFLQWQYEQ